MLYVTLSFRQVIDSLTTVKKVNKTDAATLLNNFKVSTAFMADPSCMLIFQTMEKLVQASKEELTMCPGLGPQKVTLVVTPLALGLSN